MSTRTMTSSALADAIRRYYEELDSTYERYGKGSPDGAYPLHFGYWERGIGKRIDALHRMNRVLSERASIRPGDRVLDAGCGVGGSALWLSRHCGAEVVGISLSEHQIERAHQFAVRSGLSDRVSFHVRDYLATGFPDQSFDVVWGLESVCHATNKADFLREAMRLLRPGGRLVVGDGFAREGASRLGEAVRERWLKGWAVPNLATPAAFERALREQGFVDISSDDITAKILPSSRDIFLLCLLRSPFYYLTLPTPRMKASFESSLLQYPALSLEAWCYCIFSARRGPAPAPSA